MTRVEYTIPGLRIREHTVAVPLDWSRPDGPSIDVFAREVVAPHRADEDLPLLLFLQGGPGGKGPRPVSGPPWLDVAIERFRVVLLDQRGTGRSSRVDGDAMRRRSGADGALHLSHFLADSIVRDAEAVRRTVYGGARWATLGQSYGGFLTLAYLSTAPEGLRGCFVTGGLPGLPPSAAEAYERTAERMLAKNRQYRARYPQDTAVVARIADLLAAEDVRLPDGDRLTVARLQHLGIGLGMGPGFEELHWLVDEAFSGSDEDRLADGVLAAIGGATAYADNPLYLALQEAIYADASSGPTGWAADAALAARPEFATGARPLVFTGETAHPWMFDEIRALRPFGPAVHELARRTDWPELYDLGRLAANAVPVTAAVYTEDLYVDSDLQRRTAGQVGNLEAWYTSEWEHDGVRQDPRVFRHLLELLDARGGLLAA